MLSPAGSPTFSSRAETSAASTVSQPAVRRESAPQQTMRAELSAIVRAQLSALAGRAHLDRRIACKACVGSCAQPSALHEFSWRAGSQRPSFSSRQASHG